MLINHLEIKIEIPLPETHCQPEISLLMLIIQKESEKLFAELATLTYQEQQRRIVDFEHAMGNVDMIRYLATQPDRGLKIITEWDAMLIEAGLID